MSKFVRRPAKLDSRYWILDTGTSMVFDSPNQSANTQHPLSTSDSPPDSNV